jgi:hypothetical protein
MKMRSEKIQELWRFRLGHRKAALDFLYEIKPKMSLASKLYATVDNRISDEGDRSSETPFAQDDNKSTTTADETKAGRGAPQRAILIKRIHAIPQESDGQVIETTLRDLYNDLIHELTELDGDLEDLSQNTIKPFSHGTIAAALSDVKAKGSFSRRSSSIMRPSEVQQIRYSGGNENISYISKLKLRDLRRLDFNFNTNAEKSLIVRRHVLLFALVSLINYYILIRII